MTRRRLATWQKQRRRQRAILITGIGLITIAVLTVLIGWIIADAIPRAKTALVVNGVEYNAGDCVDALIAYYNPSPGTVEQVAPQIVPLLERKEIIAQESGALGIEVSRDDVKSLAETSGTSKRNRWLLELDLIEQRVFEYFIDQVPTTAPQRQIHAMLLEDAGQADSARQRILDGEDFAAVATQVSVNTYSRENGGDLGWHQQDFFLTDDRLGSEIPLDWAWEAAEGELSPGLADPDVVKSGGYWIWMVAARDPEQGAHVYGMQFGNLPAAEDAYTRLEAGEEFATLADEVSQYTQSPEGSAGEIGWFTDDNLFRAMEAFVPEAPLNTPSEPVYDDGIVTKGGAWLVRVAGVDAARALSEDDIQTLGYTAYSDWVAQVTEDPGHQIEDYWIDVSEWVVAQVTAKVG
jgi:hypothetical protein